MAAGYFIPPHPFPWFWLLLASCVFYVAFVPTYVLILLVTIVGEYFAGRLIESAAKDFMVNPALHL